MELSDLVGQTTNKKYPYTLYVPNIKPSPPHDFFKFGGFGEKFVKSISPKQQVMYWGGTIAAIALQLCLVMGCKEINIYGCGFNNDNGVNYHYDCSEEHKGATNDEQRKIMQATINKIREFNVDINICGESRLD